jgi:hypothetical protein
MNMDNAGPFVIAFISSIGDLFRGYWQIWVLVSCRLGTCDRYSNDYFTHISTPFSLTLYSFAAVFLAIGLVRLAGGLITGLSAVETKGRTLEEISP